MLDFWCSNKLTKNIIVTMKFQGYEAAVDKFDRCIRIVRQQSYYLIPVESSTISITRMKLLS